MQDVVQQINNALGTSMAQIQDMMTGDAVKLLKTDHRKVKALFAAFKLATEPATKKQITKDICTELTVHAQVEEELVYPQLRIIDKGDLLVEEADLEHRLVKELVAELQNAPYRGVSYDAKVKVLQDMVEHHIKEEERDLLPKLKDVADLEVLGKQITARKQEIMAKLAKAPKPRRRPAARKQPKRAS